MADNYLISNYVGQVLIHFYPTVQVIDPDTMGEASLETVLKKNLSQDNLGCETKPFSNRKV